MNLLFYLLACLTFENKFSIDNDEDGFSVYDGDCNDNDSTITVVECTDNDGDGKSEYEGDCDDENPNINLGAAELDDLTECMLDADGDGFGDSTLREGVTPGTDCDDSDPDIKPTQSEICDGIDNNCDDAIDIDAEDSTTWYYDADGDFYGSSLNPIESCEKPEYYTEAKYDDDGVLIFDCDDGNRFAFPTAGEVCDGVDNDCDGLIDDADEDLLGNATRYKDADGDGFGDPNIFVLSCDPIAGFVQGDDPLTDAYIDCDDGNPAVYPSADEVCDGFDNDCDGLMDDADDGVLVDGTWYVDNDDDGYGTFTETLVQCEQPEGYASVGTDCDDESPFVFPGSEEVCDGIDNNCTGGVDEGLTVPWYADDDGDGFGASPQVTAALFACPETPPEGYVENFDDCNDSGILNANGIAIGLMAFPGADEYCDGIDNDCDTIVDENGAVDGMLLFRDVDNDSYGTSSITKVSCFLEEGYIDNDQDCNDQDASINPEGTETCQDGADEDCDGSNNDINALLCTVYYQDSDGDYFGNLEVSLCMCEEENDFTSLIATDCDDSNITVNPEATETCETEYDDNCDGSSNDMFAIGCSLFYKDDDLDGFGTDENQCLCVEEDVFRAEIDGDCNDTTALIHPNKPEICDEDDTDENCDGLADDASAIPLGDDPGAVFWYRDGDSDNFGDDDTFVKQCDAPIGYISMNGDCDDGLSSVNPSKEETCFSNDDEDCSGTNNDDGAIGCATFYADVDGDSYGTNADSQCLCYAEDVYTSTLSTDCDDESDAVNPGKDEVCDEADIDENCNGQADEMNAKECDVYFYDADDDGYGIATNTRCLCAADGAFRALVGGDCEDDDASYNPDFENCGLMGDIETSDAALEFQNFTHSGVNLLATDFDYNNDGYEDFAYAIQDFDTDYIDAGAVFLFLGPFDSNIDFSPETIVDEADLYFTIEQAETGIHTIYGGNIDDDVFDEIVVFSNTGTYIINDNLIGMGVLTNSSDGIISYAGIGRFRTYNPGKKTPLISARGDFNGDGLLDEVRGLPSITSDGTNSMIGIQYDIEAPRPQIISTYLNFFDQSFFSNDSNFGSGFEIEDINKDGIDDLIVLANGNKNLGYNTIYMSYSIFYGSDVGLFPSTINNRDGVISKDRYDIDGDGVEELLISSNEQTQTCLIYNPISEEIIESDISGNKFSCGWGDINDDGYYDVIARIYGGSYNFDTMIWWGDGTEITTLSVNDGTGYNFGLGAHTQIYFLDHNNDGIQDICYGSYCTLWNNSFMRMMGFNTFASFSLLQLTLDNEIYPVWFQPHGFFDGNFSGISGRGIKYCSGSGVYDFNEDGSDDIICSDRIYSNVYFSSEYTPLGNQTVEFPQVQMEDLDNNAVIDAIFISKYSALSWSQWFSSDSVSKIVLNPLHEEQRIIEGYLIEMFDSDNDGYNEIAYSIGHVVNIENFIQNTVSTIHTNIENANGFFANIKGDETQELVLFDRCLNACSLESKTKFEFYQYDVSSAEWILFQKSTYHGLLIDEGIDFQVLDKDEDGYHEMYVYDEQMIFSSNEYGVQNIALSEKVNTNVNMLYSRNVMEHMADFDGDMVYETVSLDSTYEYYDSLEGTIANAGKVEIVLSATNFPWEFIGTSSEVGIGFNSNIADVNGDGNPDVLIENSCKNSCGYLSKTYLFYGPLDTYYNDDGTIRPARPDDADATFQGRVLNTLDANNDGFQDLLMISSSEVFLYHGAPNSAVEPPISPSE